MKETTMERDFRNTELDCRLRRVGKGWNARDYDSINPEAIIAQFKEMEVNAITFYLRDPEGRFNNPKCRRLVELCRENGISPVIIITVVLDKSRLLTEQHPEWLVVAEGGWHQGRQRPDHQLCINSPYRQYFLGTVADVVGSMDVAGVMFDEIHRADCRCDHCRALYRKECGAEMPLYRLRTDARARFHTVRQRGNPEPLTEECTLSFFDGETHVDRYHKVFDEHGALVSTDAPQMDLDDPEIRRYVQWCYRNRTEFLAEVKRAVHAIKPGLPISNIMYTMTSHPAVYLDAHAMGDLSDILSYYSVDTVEYLVKSQYARLFRSVSKRRADIWEIATGALSGELSYATTSTRSTEAPIPPALYLANAMTIISNGLAASCDIYPSYPDGRLREDLAENVRLANREIKEREPWLLGTEPLADVALVYSETSHNFYRRRETEKREARGQDWRNYITEYTGTYKALMESQVPFDALLGERITDDSLSRYRVVLLPSTVCLSEAQMAALERYVRKGGGLVATYRTSLMDERGEFRDDFGLSSLLGVALVGEGIEDRDWLTRHSQPTRIPPVHAGGFARICSGLLGEEFPEGSLHYCYDVPRLRVKATAADVDATLYTGTRLSGKSDPDVPLILSRRHGEGRVIYIPFRVGALYQMHCQVAARKLLKGAVRAVHPGGSLPIEVSGPVQCEVNAYFQESGDRMVIHFTNYQGVMLRGAPSEQITNPSVDYIPPLVDIAVRVKVPDPAVLSAVYLAPERQALAWEKDGEDIITIRVPRIGAHGMVVLECAGADGLARLRQGLE
ncbi:MAG: beta-galactosidase trimerization domain-containing protein [Armatimonadetes bacterium]|nr:beta-galactosidase trimerization domain-containing protein [Armatimonadota bacterium]